MYQNNAGMKHKKTTLLQENHDKKGLEAYSTPVAWLWNKWTVVF